MTVLSAAQSAMMRLVKYRPQSVFSSEDPTVQEVADLVNEVAHYIVKKHDWQAMTGIGTFTGDGVTTSFPKPDDYDRMLVASNMQQPGFWFWNYTHMPTVDDWLWLKNSGIGMVNPGAWILLDNQFQFYPTPPSAQQAQFPYVRNTYARSDTGVPKQQFDADTDSFVLDEQLLTLGLVWMWRQQKRLDSSQEEVDFMDALSQEAGRDQGARTIVHNQRWNRNTRAAWPFALGPNV